jgi:hypothetical protein
MLAYSMRYPVLWAGSANDPLLGRCRNRVGWSDHHRFNGRLVWRMRPALYSPDMPDKPDPESPDDSYSEEETAKRRDATIRAMIGMPAEAAFWLREIRAVSRWFSRTRA